MSAHQKQSGVPAGRGRGRPILGQGVRQPQSPQAPLPQASPPQAPPPQAHAPSDNFPYQQPPNHFGSGFAFSVDAAPFVPSWQQQTYALPDAVEVLRTAISDLIKEPDQFNERLVPVIPAFLQIIQTEDKLREVINELVEKGITEPNNRDLAARLCSYFAKNFTAQYKNGTFRQHLLKRLHAEHVNREQTAADESTQHRVLGFTLFMAELLDKLVTADGTPMVVIANALHELLSLLMTLCTEQALSHVVQTLKLVGHMMEKAEAISDPNHSNPKMDELMLKIKDSVVAENLSRRIRRQLLRAIELRALLWEQDLSNAASDAAAAPLSDAVLRGGVYYGDNGQVYTWEDATFCDVSPEDTAISEFQALSVDDNGIIGNGLNNQDDSFPHEQWSNNDGDEMDEEASAAFEAFLSQIQAQQNNGANYN